MTESLYPHVKVALIGEDSNAFTILGKCAKAARQAGVPKNKIDEFVTEAMDGDYEHLLMTCTEWFDCF